jgi:VWFA-related protein
MRVSTILLLAAFCANQLVGQDAPPASAPPLRSLPIVLHDKHGAPQSTVHKEDLQLLVDSKPAQVQSLVSDGPQPLLLGLLLDTSHRQEQVLADEKKPDEAFLDARASRPGDRLFVLHFDREIELMQDLTADKSLLRTAVEDLRPASEEAQAEDDDKSDDEDAPHRHKPSGTKLYDAIFLASDEVLRAGAGRKAVIVISDGLDRGSKESLASAVESAQRTGTVVYTIYVEGEREKEQDRRGNQNGGQQQRRSGGGIGWPSGGGGYPGGGSGGGQGGGQSGGQGQGRGNRGPQTHEDGRKILLEISKKTGGAMFEAKKKEDIGGLLTQVAQYLQDEYRITFQPDPQSTGDFHRVSLKANPGGWSAQVPEAYYGH